jgi:glycosyltransferase involved in cell wall biosynthesis
MFPRIVDRYPEAHLNVFCDLENKWLLEHHSEQVEEIQILLEKHKDCVINYGWVNQKILNIFWSTSHVWLYPCTFAETCCLTAYEAAASKTLAISNDLAALRESVGYEKAIIVEGDATTEEWKDKVLDKLFNVLDNGEESKYVDKNFHWVSENKNFETTVKEFADKFLI